MDTTRPMQAPREDGGSLRPGDRLGVYTIIARVGAGGMGEVYLAEDPRLHRRVALKILFAELASDATSLKRFEREARAASALNHPSILTIYELGEDRGIAYIAGEFVDGETLRQRLARGAPPLDEAIDLALQIASALSVAHTASILHRDIKPENVMIRRDGLVKVLDFGLAKLLAPIEVTDEETIERTTTPGSVIGTVHYMSPEQVRGGQLDARSDVFSFGAMLYELITRELPFEGETASHVMVAILDEEPRPLAHPELQQIVAKALRKNPADRYQSMAELAADLRNVPRDGVVTKTLPQPQVQPSRRVPYAIGAAVAIVMIAAIAWWRPWIDRGPLPRIPIVVADFENQTGEPQFDGLSGMLITSLEQSRRLDVMSRARMFDVLRSLGRGEVSRIDEALGRDVSRAEDAHGLVVASVSRFGETYIVDLKVLDPKTNEYLLTVKDEGRGQESIPELIDHLSEELRLGLDEAKQDVREARTTIGQATTPDLRAYQHYFYGEQLLRESKFAKAHSEFVRATQIDPQFAMAWYRAADSEWEQIGTPRARNSIARAVALSERVPQRERLSILALDAAIRGDYARGAELRKAALQLAPDDKETLFHLGDCLYRDGRAAEAIPHLRRVLSLDPMFERAHQQLVFALRSAERWNEASEATAAYVKRFDTPYAWWLRTDNLLLTGHHAEAVEAARRIRDDGGNPLFFLPVPYVRLAAGDIDGALRDARAARESPRAHDRFAAQHVEVIAAVQRGKYREALKLYDALLASAPAEISANVIGLVASEKALLLAMVGDAERSRVLTEELLRSGVVDEISRSRKHAPAGFTGAFERAAAASSP